MKEIIFKMSKSELEKFLDITKELVKINEDFKIIFTEAGILIYTILGEKSGKINALKIFPFKWGEIFTQYPNKLYLNITLMEGKKFNDKMAFLLDTKLEDVEICITYNKDLVGYSLSGKNEFLEVRSICQASNLVKDLTFDILKEKLNEDYSEWNFDIPNEQLTKIIKLSKIDSLNELINIRIEHGNIAFSDNQWDLKITKIDKDITDNICFKKIYLKYIINHANKDSFTLSVFDSYIVCNETKSYLLFSMDLSD